MALEATSLPVPPSAEFIAHLSNNPQTPTRELVQPYLDYELRLREAFVAKDSGPDKHANLVPIYNGQQEGLLKARTMDREKGDITRSKYIMPLHKGDYKEAGKSAIVEGIGKYRDNFDAFTHGVLASLDWSNVVVAGSAALLPMLPRRKHVREWRPIGTTVQDQRESYYQRTARSSDIDIFLYGLDSEDAAISRIIQVETAVRQNQRLAAETGLTLRTDNAITFISPRYPYRHVQIILRLYQSISEILTGFDVDCACVAYDGNQVYSTPRGVAAITTRTNTIDLTRRSPSYENRLCKYRNHKFDVYWEHLDRPRIPERAFQRWHWHEDAAGLRGLSRLMYFEQYFLSPKRMGFDRYRRARALKRIAEAGEPGASDASGYAALEVPYGERFNAATVRRYVERHSTSAHMFGTILQVVEGDDSEGKGAGKNKLAGRLTFITDNPGRQMIGSFNPVTEDDWTKGAYSRDGEPHWWHHKTALLHNVEYSEDKGDDLDQLQKLLNTEGVELEPRDRDGRTPLLAAVELDLVETIKMMLEHGGMDANPIDNRGMTPLLMAIRYGKVRSVAALVNHSAVDVNAVDPEIGGTVLSVATMFGGVGHAKMVELIMGRQDVEMDAKNLTGRTALHHAARSGNVDIIKMLLADPRVDKNLRDVDGRTALSVAAEYRHVAVAKLLLGTEGINVHAKDNDGRTALSWAGKENEEIVKALSEHAGGGNDGRGSQERTPGLGGWFRNRRQTVKKLLSAANDKLHRLGIS